MQWRGRTASTNVEDVRGSRAMRTGVGGGIGMLAIIVLYALMGGDVGDLVQNLPQQPAESSGSAEPYQESPEEAEQRQFISVVLAETESAWQQIFQSRGGRYEEPKLVLFKGAVESGCGLASAAVGPFYCPANGKAYIDLSFYDDLQNRFGAAGDFAQAYVIAHEIGHHVQNLMGTSEKVHGAQSRSRKEEANALSVGLELQADCYAGIWANHARKLLEPGDIEEGLRAAAAIGDDRLQMQTKGYVSPESFTHGSSEQRVKWFKRGIDGGTLESCDTFGSGSP